VLYAVYAIMADNVKTAETIVRHFSHYSNHHLSFPAASTVMNFHGSLATADVALNTGCV